MKRCGPVKRQRPDRLARLLLCEALIAPVEKHLRTTGLEEREDAALIAGYIVEKDIGIATTALLPYTENSTASCTIPLEVTIECIDVMNRAGLVFLAQVHSHPGRFSGHSDVDDTGAFSDCPGVFSIVVPQFGHYGMRRLLKRGIGIHERMPDGRWRELLKTEVRKRLAILPSHYKILEPRDERGT
jgi:hypothetical protein